MSTKTERLNAMQIEDMEIGADLIEMRAGQLARAVAERNWETVAAVAGRLKIVAAEMERDAL